jgi:iron complex transport system ATP-binding protein
MTTPAVTCRDLAIGYPQQVQPLVSNLSLALSAGQFVFLLGPNGVGKTTLLKTLAGLMEPRSGSIHYAGRLIVDLSRHELARQRSIVLSPREVDGSLRVRELVALGRLPYADWLGTLSADDDAAVTQALAATDSIHLADRPARQLSDGERQRVLIARALAQSTPVIFLDEPTAFIDLPGRMGIVGVLKRAAHEMNKAILLSTHDLDMALEVADQVWVLDREGSLEEGMPEELVLRGTFNRAFPSSARFDPQTGRFRWPHELRGSVIVVGDGLTADWTARALQRVGLRTRVVASTELQRLNENRTPVVWTPTEPGADWRVHSGDRDEMLTTLRDVVERLRPTLETEIDSGAASSH